MRKVILLDRLALGTIDESYRVAFWLEVPVERQPFYANPQAASVVKNITTEELTDLRAGRFVEAVVDLTRPQGISETEARAMLEASYTRRQQELHALNPWDRYGTYWDGDAWHDVTVA